MPRYVKTYTRKDGTIVNGYTRRGGASGSWTYKPNVTPRELTKEEKRAGNVLLLCMTTFAICVYFTYDYFSLSGLFGIFLAWLILTCCLVGYYGNKIKEKDSENQNEV